MKRMIPLFVLVMLLFSTGSALAQDYSYNVEQMEVHVFWNADGTQSLDYTITFQNDPNGHAIEYVDLGMPNASFDESSIYADSNGIQLTDISSSGFEGTGSGVAIYMAGATIPPGGRGTLHVFAGKVDDVLYADTEADEYASAVFALAQFEQPGAYGDTAMTVTFHLPPGVSAEEPRWHEAPAGWIAEPQTGFDENGRITYTWTNPNAAVWQVQNLGASFPLSYVPGVSLQKENPFAWIGNLTKDFDPGCCIPILCFGFFGGVIGLGLWNDRNRKFKYLPPKISIEGVGIKRGLTAVEAAVLMEQPVDKVFTMILFGLLKKNAAQVTKQKPLKISAADTEVELRDYEKEFMAAFQIPTDAGRQKALKEMFVNMIKALGVKMKGFSRNETVAYYKDIMKRAWAQVEAANTPEVKSEKYDEYMEWTMLDRDWSDRTRDVFRTGPVFVPVWFPRYNPGMGGTPGGTGTSSSSGGRVSMPGADFANSVTGGLQTFAAGVVGSVTDFTNSITKVTNPPPPPSRSSSGGGFRGGGGCACACACAGCACACAGGGR